MVDLVWVAQMWFAWGVCPKLTLNSRHVFLGGNMKWKFAGICCLLIFGMLLTVSPRAMAQSKFVCAMNAGWNNAQPEFSWNCVWQVILRM